VVGVLLVLVGAGMAGVLLVLGGEGVAGVLLVLGGEGMTGVLLVLGGEGLLGGLTSIICFIVDKTSFCGPQHPPGERRQKRKAEN